MLADVVGTLDDTNTIEFPMKFILHMALSFEPPQDLYRIVDPESIVRTAQSFLFVLLKISVGMSPMTPVKYSGVPSDARSVRAVKESSKPAL